jgi:hypothetical protein
LPPTTYLGLAACHDQIMDDEKYIVTKADGTPVDDAVVIRLKDPFAATALYTYANTIMSFMELLRDADQLSKEEALRLLDIVDYFNTQADQSTKITGKRLPD